MKTSIQAACRCRFQDSPRAKWPAVTLGEDSAGLRAVYSTREGTPLVRFFVFVLTILLLLIF